MYVDPIELPNVWVSDKRWREADPISPRYLKGKAGMRKYILVEKRRRLEKDDVVGRKLGEEVLVDSVEEVLGVGK